MRKGMPISCDHAHILNGCYVSIKSSISHFFSECQLRSFINCHILVGGDIQLYILSIFLWHMPMEHCVNISFVVRPVRWLYANG